MSKTQISFEGNLTGDPETRTVQMGNDSVQVTNFTVAVNTSKFENGGWQEKGSCFYRVAAWRRLSDGAASSLRKGDPVVVVGTLEHGSYTHRETGSPVATFEVDATHVGFSVRHHQVSGQKRQAGQSAGQGSAASYYGQSQAPQAGSAQGVYGQPPAAPQVDANGWAVPQGQAPQGHPAQYASQQAAPAGQPVQGHQSWGVTPENEKPF